jgi:cytoskeletal protein CcmA (bactofilin family)
MLFSKKRPPPIRSLVGEGTVLRGTVTFVEGLRIDGEVVGDVLCGEGAHSIVVISEKANVQGRVKAAHVIVAGAIVGPVEATELLELQPSARVTGDIRYEALEMHAGAVIDGELRSLKSADKPALKLAASAET